MKFSIMKVHLLSLFTVLAVFMATVSATSELLKNCEPPSFRNDDKKNVTGRVDYLQGDGVSSIPCFAEGNATLKYTWYKDEQVLNMSSPRFSLASGIGTLIIKPTSKEDVGVYQCKVENSCGSTISTKTSLKWAYIEPFPKQDLPTKRRAALGQGLTLKCSPPDSVPTPSIKWVESDESDPLEVDVEESERITMDYAGNLYFVHIVEGDAKTYTCYVNNHQVRLISVGNDKIIETAGTSINNMPATLEWASDQEVEALEGDTAKFKCIFFGNPAPTVRWRRVDDGTYDTSRMQISKFKHEFKIKDVELQDAGKYECSAENPLLKERKKKVFTLKVQARPSWRDKPADQKIGVEENATFVCDARGDPRPDIQWYVNGIPVENTPHSPNRRLQGNTLIFTNLSQSDSQTLQCNASNTHGYLWVDVKLQVVAEKPSIAAEPRDRKVAEETDVTIPCDVEGKPRPTVQWYKGDQLLEGDRYTILRSGDLVVKAALIRDKGQYSCHAKNRFGYAEASGNLIVRKKTKIIGAPLNETVSYGEMATFRCTAETDDKERDKLTYTWLKDGQEVDKSDPRIVMNKGELTIMETTSKDTASYTCTADNALDSDSHTATLKVIAPPDPPYNVSVVSCGEGADIIWEYDDKLSNFSPLTGFVVEYNNSHEPEKWVESSRPSETSRQASVKLLPFAKYNFRLRAVNKIGTGDPSEPSDTECQTDAKKPFRHPNKVVTVGDKTGYLVIEWEPMKEVDHNGADFRYVITYREEGQSEKQTYEENNPKEHRHEVKVDNIYKKYFVTVSSKNERGEPLKKAVEIEGYSGEAKPSVVVENFDLDEDIPVSATSASFVWDPVDTSPDKMNGKFEGYKIRYWKKDEFNTTRHEVVVVPEVHGRGRRAVSKDGKVRGRVSNLPSYSEIEADVVVVNTYFSSEGSNVVNFTTPEGVPGRLSYFAAQFRGSSHFVLAWGPPEEENGVITGYDIGYQKIMGLAVKPMVYARQNIPPDVYRTTIDGLEDNTLYRVYAWARTKEGPGKKFPIDLRTTNSTAPLAIPEIKEVIPFEETANVTWDVVAKKKGARFGSICYLEYRELGSKQWDRSSKGATDHFWMVLDKLEPRTDYEVRIVCMPDPNSQDFQQSSKQHFQTTGIRAAKGSVLSAGWFIGMMVAIAILLLILIIVCIVKRNRGKEYKFPPEKDTVDEPPGHFNEMAKSEKNGLGASASFERDPEKVPLEEETDSLEDYGDVDPTKFNEDGSFIGQYGSGKPEEAPNPSSIV